MDISKELEAEEFGQAEERILRAYKAVFLTDEGQLVLQDMLFELYFLRNCETSEQQALCNYAKSLLVKVYGVPIESSRLAAIIKKLLRRRAK